MNSCVRCSAPMETERGMCDECEQEAICIECGKWMPVDDIDERGACNDCQPAPTPRRLDGFLFANSEREMNDEN